MREAVIVSTARTPIGKAYRGALNNTKSPTMMAHAIDHAVQRAGVDGGEIEDVVIGSVLTAGTAGMNVGRLAVLAADLPVTVSAQTIDRQCSSGLMAIATAAKQIIVDGMQVAVAGGQENISAVQNRYMEWVAAEKDANVLRRVEHAYMPMLYTAEYVARKFGISREVQDRYSLESQQRTAAAQQAGRFDAEIVPIATSMALVSKETKEVSYKDVVLSKDEGNRADTTLESLLALKPIVEGGCITAGNASQLSDGASACVVMEAKLAESRGLSPLGIYRGIAVAGNLPEEMGIGPIYAIPRLLERQDRVEPVTVEIQIRTVAMDFWASLEHKIFYKYQGEVPVDLVHDLKQAADVANRLDVKMERLHDQVVALEPPDRVEDDLLGIAGLSQYELPEEFLASMALARQGDELPERDRA